MGIYGVCKTDAKAVIKSTVWVLARQFRVEALGRAKKSSES